MSINSNPRIWLKNYFFVTVLCAIHFLAAAQSTWQMKKDHDGIQVFTRTMEGSRVKEVRVTCVIDATLSQLSALLMDAPAHENWVYNTRQSYLVRQIDPLHQIYYSETSLPWPMANRDVVVDLTISQDPKTKILKVSGRSVDAVLPAKKGIVRVPMSQVSWTITPAANNTVTVDYTAKADPGGSVPVWLVNAFITKGPLETFIKLKKLVKTEAYRQAQYAFIKN